MSDRTMKGLLGDDNEPRYPLGCDDAAMRPDSLDAAWAEVEALRPKGSDLTIVSMMPGSFGAYCRNVSKDVWSHDEVVENPTKVEGHGPTLAAALHALAAKLAAAIAADTAPTPEYDAPHE